MHGAEYTTCLLSEEQSSAQPTAASNSGASPQDVVQLHERQAQFSDQLSTICQQVKRLADVLEEEKRDRFAALEHLANSQRAESQKVQERFDADVKTLRESIEMDRRSMQLSARNVVNQMDVLRETVDCDRTTWETFEQQHHMEMERIQQRILEVISQERAGLEHGVNKYGRVDDKPPSEIHKLIDRQTSNNASRFGLAHGDFSTRIKCLEEKQMCLEACCQESVNSVDDLVCRIDGLQQFVMSMQEAKRCQDDGFRSVITEQKEQRKALSALEYKLMFFGRDDVQESSSVENKKRVKIIPPLQPGNDHQPGNGTVLASPSSAREKYIQLDSGLAHTPDLPSNKDFSGGSDRARSRSNSLQRQANLPRPCATVSQSIGPTYFAHPCAAVVPACPANVPVIAPQTVAVVMGPSRCLISPAQQASPTQSIQKVNSPAQPPSMLGPSANLRTTMSLAPQANQQRLTASSPSALVVTAEHSGSKRASRPPPPSHEDNCHSPRVRSPQVPNCGSNAAMSSVTDIPTSFNTVVTVATTEACTSSDQLIQNGCGLAAAALAASMMQPGNTSIVRPGSARGRDDKQPLVRPPTHPAGRRRSPQADQPRRPADSKGGAADATRPWVNAYDSGAASEPATRPGSRSGTPGNS